MSNISEPSHCSKMGKAFDDGCAIRHTTQRRVFHDLLSEVTQVREIPEHVMSGTFVKTPNRGDRTLRGERDLGWTPEMGGMISVNIWNYEINGLTPVLMTLCEMTYTHKCIVNRMMTLCESGYAHDEGACDGTYFNIAVIPSPMNCSSSSERAWLDCEYEHDGKWISTDTMLGKMHEPDSPTIPDIVVNACIQCGVDIGECNPRQYCRKYYCPN